MTDSSYHSTSDNPSVNKVPLNEIVVRQWDLNENSTHYDRLVAAPKDEDLIKFWAGWAGIMLSTAVLTTAIWIPLVASKKIKKNPFNLYLIFLFIPDMLVSWTCGFTCLSNALAGHFTSEFMCYFQSWYMVASITANSWLNALVAYQLYTMLSSAQRFIRYQPPTSKRVVIHSVCIYLYSTFLGCWGLVNTDWWPHKTRLTIGSACLPMDYSTTSTVFFYCVFFPLFFGIPLLYVSWAAFKIYRHQMVPPSGRRRVLAIYFGRLVFVFLVMWLPGLLLLFVTGAWLNPWVEWVGGSWSHLQGAVSALVSLLKPDIWKTVRDFWTCRSSSDDDKTRGESDWFTSFGSMVGSTRFSLRSSLLALGTSMRHGKRANSFSGDIDLMDEDSPFCSSSVPAKIDRTDCVLTSAEFTSQIHAHSCTVEELIPRQSLPIVQMMDSSSSSDDDNDAEISSDTDEKQSKNVQLPNDRGSGNTNREEHDDGLIGENKQQDQTSIPYGDNHNNVQTTCHESDLSSGGTIAECNDEDNAMQHEPSNRCHVEQNPAGDTFRDEDCESQPVCTEGISTRETFDNEGMQDDVQTAVVEGASVAMEKPIYDSQESQH